MAPTQWLIDAVTAVTAKSASPTPTPSPSESEQTVVETVGRVLAWPVVILLVLTGGGALERFLVTAPGIALYGGLSYRFEAL